MPNKAKAQPAAPSEDALRTRAYLLWEADGRPEGMADHYWIKAHELDQAVQADVHATATKTAAAMKADKSQKQDKGLKQDKGRKAPAGGEAPKAGTVKTKSAKTRLVEPAKARLKAVASKVAALAVKAKPAAKAPKKL